MDFSILAFCTLLLQLCYTRGTTSSLPCLMTAPRIWVEVEPPVTGWYYRINNSSKFQRQFARDIYFTLTLVGSGTPYSITLTKYESRKKVLSYERNEIALFCPDEMPRCQCRSLKLSGLPEYNGEYTLNAPPNRSEIVNVFQREESFNSTRNSSSALGDAAEGDNSQVSNDENCETGQQCESVSQDTVNDVLGDYPSFLSPPHERCKKAEDYIFRHRNDIWWISNSESSPIDAPQANRQSSTEKPAEETHSAASGNWSSISSQEITSSEKSGTQQPLEPTKSHKQKRWAVAKSVDRFHQKSFLNDFHKKLLKIKNDVKTSGSVNPRGFPHEASADDYMDRNSHGLDDGERWSWPAGDEEPSEEEDGNNDASELRAAHSEGTGPEWDCLHSYLQLLTVVRLQRDQELDAWTLARGNQLLAVSESSTLCPESTSGDWWWLEIQPPEAASQPPQESTSRAESSVDTPHAVRHAASSRPNARPATQGPQVLPIPQYSDDFDYHSDANDPSNGENGDKLVKKNVMVSCLHKSERLDETTNWGGM